MDYNNVTEEYALNRALELYEQGIAQDAIFAQFRDHHAALADMFAMIGLIEDGGQAATPSREEFATIMDAIISHEESVADVQSVTLSDTERYQYRGGSHRKGRPSITNVDYNYTHTMNWKVLLPVGVVVVLVLIFVAANPGSDSRTATNNTGAGDTTPVVDEFDFDETNPSASIDNALAVLDSIADQENQAFTDAATDASNLGFVDELMNDVNLDQGIVN